MEAHEAHRIHPRGQLILECVQRLARIESKLDAAVQANIDQERRIRSLEAHRWIIYGIFVSFAAALAMLRLFTK
jgi:hypothetical protein